MKGCTRQIQRLDMKRKIAKWIEFVLTGFLNFT